MHYDKSECTKLLLKESVLQRSKTVRKKSSVKGTYFSDKFIFKIPYMLKDKNSFSASVNVPQYSLIHGKIRGERGRQMEIQ